MKSGTVRFGVAMTRAYHDAHRELAPKVIAAVLARAFGEETIYTIGRSGSETWRFVVGEGRPVDVMLLGPPQVKPGEKGLGWRYYQEGGLLGQGSEVVLWSVTVYWRGAPETYERVSTAAWFYASSFQEGHAIPDGDPEEQARFLREEVKTQEWNETLRPLATPVQDIVDAAKDARMPQLASALPAILLLFGAGYALSQAVPLLGKKE